MKIKNNNICIGLRLFIVGILFVIFSLFFSGCTLFTKTIPDGSETSKLFYKSYDDTWNATISALGTTPLDVVDKYNGDIKTKWVEMRSKKETAGLLFGKHWKGRYRLMISIISLPALNHSTEISIVVHTEEKAVGGIQASNWQRKVSDGTLESMMFEKIGQILMN